MSRYWVSWWQTHWDYRPITFPPNKAILGWWCSGESEDGFSLCAAVEAGNEQEVFEAIKKDWPEFTEDRIRFCNRVTKDFKPSDRFPITGWMIERFDSKPEAGE